MLLGQINWARGLVHLFCTALFLYQLTKLLPSYFAQSLTNTEVSEMQLKDLDFPLNIKVCFRPSLNKTALKKLGYLDKAMFIVGRSRFNGSLIGWGGHSNESIGQRGSLRCAAEVARMTKIERKGNLLLNFTINKNSEKTEEDLANNLVKKVTLQEVNVAHDCHILNLSKIEKELKGLRMVAMLFNQTNLRDDHLCSFLELQLEGKRSGSPQRYPGPPLLLQWGRPQIGRILKLQGEDQAECFCEREECIYRRPSRKKLSRVSKLRF